MNDVEITTYFFWFTPLVTVLCLFKLGTLLVYERKVGQLKQVASRSWFEEDSMQLGDSY